MGNEAVWYEVGKLGIDQTGDAVGLLKTSGLYKYSSNPQYVADITMVLGWLLFSTSTYALPTGMLAILVLLTAPFAEEPWLAKIYGKSYTSFTKEVRRYI